MPDYRLEIVSRPAALERTVETLLTKPVFAIDIETIEWWDRRRERVALIQMAYRTDNEVKVAIVDALSDCDIRLLRHPLESAKIVKAIHNAAFDAAKLFAHYRIETAPVFDTMRAARRSGEKKYSLQSQAAAHLNIHLNKSAQRSDWSRRPLDLKQIDYAARDAFATLLLYENQIERRLKGQYALINEEAANQLALPLGASEADSTTAPVSDREQKPAPSIAEEPRAELSPASMAILGIVNEIPKRYSPEQLTVSVGDGRVGIAGWIVDRFLGRQTDFDDESAKLVILDLVDRRLIQITEYGRLEATEPGSELWRKIK